MNQDVKDKMVADVKDAIANGNVETFANNMVSFLEETEARIKADYESLKDEHDAQILKDRGYRALTSKETKFYDSLVEIARTRGAVTQSLTDIDVTIPETIFDEVFEGIRRDHPLLDRLNLVNTKSITAKWLLNTGLEGVAGWGELCSEIDDQLKSGFVAVEVNMNKLSAYMYLCLTIVELGYEWLHRYCVMCLAEAIATALELAVVAGTGSNQPIGMTKVIAEVGQTQTIPAQDKEAITINDLSVATLGGIAKTLSNNGTRKVDAMLMIVNPLDAYDKVAPAVTVLNATGEYVRRYAFPMEVIESSAVPEGKAIFGLGRQYFLGVGLGRDGRVTYSDDFKFLDDVRTIKHKLVAGGQPKDNNSFVYADISNLAPAYFNVKIVEDASI